MKIVINAVSAKRGGAVTYLTNVLRSLPPAGNGLQFVVLLPPETAEKQKALPESIRLVPTTVGHASSWRRLWWEQVSLRRLLKKEKPDILFSTANFGMLRCPVRQLLLVRTQLYFSKIYLDTVLPKHPRKARLAFKLRRWLCCQSVRSADVVMTPTRAMLDDLRRFVEVKPEKALMNPYGVASDDGVPQARATTIDKPPQQAGQTVRLVYVSLYAEHKNLNTLLKAMPLLNRNSARKFVLRTTADPTWKEASWMVTVKEDLALARQGEVRECVQFVGPLDREQTQELYRSADIFVFPSLTESFGHPMAEAMACGLPIIASDTPVNREICAEAAVYFSPLNPKDLAEKVQQVASADDLRRRLKAAGHLRAATHFCWDAHVQRLMLGLSESYSARPITQVSETIQSNCA